MIHRVRKQLLSYLLGALDDSEAELVRERLESDPVYQQELEYVRRQLDQLRAAKQEFQPPPGLARRTCDFVFSCTRRSSPRRPARDAMSPHAAMPCWASRMGWLDTAVAAAVFIMAGLVVVPAIHSGRFQARLSTCQDNLRQIGLSLAEYSQKHGNYFPRVPIEGKLAAAGIYAPMLVRDGFLTEPQRVICPESPMADQKDLGIPSIEELEAASSKDAARLRRQMGGSYGYCLGHLEHGVLTPTKNLHRATFALMADAPSDELSEHQSVNHGGSGQNVLFEDGHVAFATCSQPCSGTDDIFSNDNHEVAAGVHTDDSVIAASDAPPIIFVNYR